MSSPRSTNPDRRTYASLASIRQIALPDGAPLDLFVRADNTFGVVWDVGLQRAGTPLGGFRLAFVDGAMRAKGARAEATGAYWQMDAGFGRTLPDGGLALLAALVLTSHGRSGLPRPGSLVEIGVSPNAQGDRHAFLQRVIEVASASGVPGVAVHNSRHCDLLMVCQPHLPTARLVAALMGDDPIAAHDLVLPDAHEILAALDLAHTAPCPPNSQMWLSRLLCARACMGNLPYDEAAAWYQHSVAVKDNMMRMSDARYVWHNTPATPATDPIPHLQLFDQCHNLNGMAWWLHRAPLPVWHRAMPWVLAQAPDVLTSLLPYVPSAVLSGLPADVLAHALHDAPPLVRERIITSLGALAA